ncbi:MAG: T9SS type A sorting domain-containing protein [Flavobacteriales bacterium]|nr:T9SS type A sorting domain-containing protein [Flavobacteriales bacterium]
MPIELLEFEAKADPPTGVRLNWRTATELNNDHFTVERSADLFEWVAVATVPGAGNSSTALSYVTLDPKPRVGINYYRLRQTDMDGTSTLSHTESVLWAKASDVSLFPNPAHEQLIVVAAQLEQGSLRLFNASGAEIRVPIVIGADRAWVRTAELPAGVYLLRLDGPGGHSSHPFLVE